MIKYLLVNIVCGGCGEARISCSKCGNSIGHSEPIKLEIVGVEEHD